MKEEKWKNLLGKLNYPKYYPVSQEQSVPTHWTESGKLAKLFERRYTLQRQ